MEHKEMEKRHMLCVYTLHVDTVLQLQIKHMSYANNTTCVWTSCFFTTFEDGWSRMVAEATKLEQL